MGAAFLHILYEKKRRKRTPVGRCFYKSTLPPRGESNCAVTPGPCHHDTGKELPT